MNRKILPALSIAAIFICTPLLAQNAEGPAIPPENALKTSEIIAKVEARPDFRYLDEVDWDEEGYYEIIYFTNDKAKVELRINPVSGEPI